jgi:hypothetical protein
VSAGDAPSVALVEQNEIGPVLDCVANRRRLAAVEFVEDLNEQVRAFHLDDRQELIIS